MVAQLKTPLSDPVGPCRTLSDSVGPCRTQSDLVGPVGPVGPSFAAEPAAFPCIWAPAPFRTVEKRALRRCADDPAAAWMVRTTCGDQGRLTAVPYGSGESPPPPLRAHSEPVLQLRVSRCSKSPPPRRKGPQVRAAAWSRRTRLACPPKAGPSDPVGRCRTLSDPSDLLDRRDPFPIGAHR